MIGYCPYDPAYMDSGTTFVFDAYTMPGERPDSPLSPIVQQPPPTCALLFSFYPLYLLSVMPLTVNQTSSMNPGDKIPR